MIRLLLLGALALGAAGILGAQQVPMQLDLDTSAQAAGDAVTGLSSQESLLFQGKSPLVDIAAQLSMSSDGKYGADIANFSNSKKFFNNYFLLDQGYTLVHLSPLEIQLGRYIQTDAFQSPYSLFLNSQGNSALGMRIKYADQFFSYESRWICLNADSHFDSPEDGPAAWSSTNGNPSNGFPDRGANIKTYTFHFGDSLDVGIQDAGVYTGRSFDLEYFVSPLPEYFTQYVKTTAGRPWTTSGNENNLIGFFVQWTKPDYDWGAQVLIDDFSLHFLFPNQVPNNPWKAAWTVGGRIQTDYGRFGLYHAGALKYTFEPITTQKGQESTSAYGYSRYPDVEYSVGNGDFRQLEITDNALGYLYGENNLAIRLTYDNVFFHRFHWNTNLEFVLAGSNSPANPWQDATASDQTGGTQWLNDPVLQQSFVWNSDLRFVDGDWEFFTTGKLGYICHLLTLQDPSGASSGGSWSNLDRYIQIFKPSSGGQVVGNLVLGFTWHTDLSGWQRSLVGSRP